MATKMRETDRSMDRVYRILDHPLFRLKLAAIEEAERDRIYCGHNLAHLLDVARIAWILNLEQGLGLAKDLVYGTALLHDLGRAAEYGQGIPHDRASAELARIILPQVGYEPKEVEAMERAILGHRGHRGHEPGPGGEGPLAGLLFEADKKSRACFACPAWESCKWPEEKKNTTIDF
ncbi:HD domain-containing protein [Kallipyga massiliensis]|uniref:HD domain-containing protein n=1 Tax=Kallipyga massiliensis TaxID=1472764 RepID=UPI0026ED3A70|nr:HD domain-containing protein [Kallipyga massiliensis]